MLTTTIPQIQTIRNARTMPERLCRLSLRPPADVDSKVIKSRFALANCRAEAFIRPVPSGVARIASGPLRTF